MKPFLIFGKTGGRIHIIGSVTAASRIQPQRNMRSAS